jgi:hypothetical protein
MRDLDRVLSHDAPTEQQLQVLLLLRARREEGWTPTTVGLELRLSLADSEEALEHLAQRGLLYPTGDNPRTFAYLHLSDRVDAQVQCLALAHEHHRRLRATRIQLLAARKRAGLLQRLIGLFSVHGRST